MGLLTSPLTVQDASAANHIFTYRSQITEKNSVVGDYVELAADPSAESKLLVKHDMSKAVYRHLIQRRINITVGTAVLPLTLGFTVTGDKLIPTATINENFVLFKDVLNEANFLSYFRAGLV